MRPETPGRGRVVESHRIARAAFVAALGFAVVAAGWSVYVLLVGGSWWGPIHSFLAGTVLLAISGASQMFTITWSSTTPPSPVVVATQRWLLVAGVGIVLVGVTTEIPGLVWVGGTAAAGGVVLLGWILYKAVRKSLLHRFDLSARFYLTALAAGVVGISLGTLMGTGAGDPWYAKLRLVHAHLNLVGLVGLTIIGTIPTLLPTTAYSRAVSGREAVVAWWLALASAVSIALGLWLPELVGVGTMGVAAAGGLILGGILSKLWDKGRHKLTFLQITGGTIWLVGWGLVDGWRVMSGDPITHFSGWTGAVVLAGVGQVLAGSLAYLIPVLKGSPFVANRQIMEGRPWLPLLSLNLAGISLGLGTGGVSVALTGLWLADFAYKVTRVVSSRVQEAD
jgi:nitrite reductase (NO-forming)